MDAVHTLAGGEIRQTPAYRSTTATDRVHKEQEKKTFSLPWARRCATSAVSYLQRRGISPDVISRCFRGGLFYEARYHGEPVCVFVGKDEAGKAKFACMRSIAGSLRKDVYGSDKEVWQDILDGLELYVQEMKDCDDMGRWIKECEDLSEQLQVEWQTGVPPDRIAPGMDSGAFWGLISGAKKECGQVIDASVQWLKDRLTTLGPQ